MQYNYPITNLDELYQTLYALPARKNRQGITPRAVTQKLLRALGNPEKKIASILITGSKGKGSTAIYVSGLLQAANLSIGRFSSPHLFDYRERITIDNQWIAEQELLRLANRVVHAANGMQYENDDEFPRFFEITTAIAYLYFAERQVDYAVIETGIGARSDATHQSVHQLAMLTNIEAEHLDIFGDVETLAIEKAGVINAEMPVVIGELPDAIQPIVLEHAKAVNAPVVSSPLVSKKITFPYTLSVGQLRWRHESCVAVKNAELAVTALQQLDISLSERCIVDTLNQIRLPARHEVVSQEPLIIIDGAHTNASAIQLFDFVHSLMNPDGRLYLLLSFSAEKNIAPVMHAFKKVDGVVLTQANDMRSLDVDEVEKLLSINDNFGIARMVITKEPNPEQALQCAVAKLGKDDTLVITGSVYLAGLMSHQYECDIV